MGGGNVRGGNIIQDDWGTRIKWGVVLGPIGVGVDGGVRFH